MNIEQFAREDGQMARQYEYDGKSVVAVDFGKRGADASVDVVDGTVIVVLADEQYEFELPEHAADPQAFIKNGVLTVEMEDDI